VLRIDHARTGMSGYNAIAASWYIMPSELISCVRFSFVLLRVLRG
jgi:hypothetical protein